MREALLRAGFGSPSDPGTHFAMIKAVATNGHRAVFGWGELFNTAVGEQVMVLESQDGQQLDPLAGPLSLRLFADLRPGARHVSSLCALVVRQ